MTEISDQEHETKKQIQEDLEKLVDDIDNQAVDELIEAIRQLHDKYYLPW